jgi:diguanylate cyclase (GGDEF)-like protein
MTELSLLQAEIEALRAEIEQLEAEKASLAAENRRLRQVEQDLLSALELAFLDKSDLEQMLELVSSHGDLVEGELIAEAKKAWEVAGMDELTQLPNRRHLMFYLDRIWGEMMRQGLPLSLLMCDVDFFKSFNDIYGHQAGDVCLYQVARGIANAIHRPNDLVGRYGGEEFVVVLPNTERQGALQVGERICAQIALLSIPHGSDRVTISVGVATVVPQRGMMPADLLPKKRRKALTLRAGM